MKASVLCACLSVLLVSSAWGGLEKDVPYAEPDRCKLDVKWPDGLLISSCRALGHPKAWFVSCPYADHGRAFAAGVPYVEMFVKGRLPPVLVPDGHD